MKAQHSNIAMIVRFVVSAVLIVLSDVNTRAQQTAPLRPEDLLDVREFGSLGPLEISPDGKWVIYEVHENRESVVADSSEHVLTGVHWDAKGENIWLVNIETHESRSLTGKSGANWSPKWSPDGQHVAFLSDRDGSGQANLWIWERATDALKKVSDLPMKA